MNKFKVLITTSGIGSRLGRLTDKTNKCLVRITDKPSISHIIESYPIGTEFVITLGHFGSYVKQYLKLAHPQVEFTFIEVDKYTGIGSSLAYSILQCKSVLKCPFIFHASDTIILNSRLPEPNKNWMAGTFRKDSSQYRTLLVRDNLIEKIYDKGAINFDSVYIGVCGINDYEVFFDKLEEIIKLEQDDLSDVHIISEMIDNKFEYVDIEYDSWFDIGNVNELNRTRECFESNIEVLDKTDESIYFFDEFIIKFFSDSEVSKNRVERGKILYGLVPEILDYTKNFYKYKKADGFLFSRSVNSTSFVKFLDWSKNNLWITSDKNIKDICYDFYISKTEKRILQYLDGKDDKETLINGHLIPPIKKLIDKIDKSWICDGISVKFHGDFILDNVIELKDGNFSLIDWRQDFGGDLEVGDIYYDLAKLNHNLIVNHDIVAKKLYSKEENNCHILINSKLNDCSELLHKFIVDNKFDLKKVKTLTALIWINMAPLHEYPFNDFLFNFGKLNLYKNINYYR